MLCAFFIYLVLMSLRAFIDQLGTEVKISWPPQRILSLVPSQTELLADLELADRVVGITKFCVHPESWRKTKTIIGGTKNFNFEMIHDLKPDLIIGNKEENYQEGIDQLCSTYPVWMSDIVTVTDALTMIERVGELTGTSEKAAVVTQQIEKALHVIEKLKPVRTLYLIWRNPWMAAAPGTFIHEMMTLAGLTNCVSQYQRYPELTNQEIIAANPELILLSSEPYPFQEKHISEIRKICPTAKVLLVDGEMFSWYGSRLTKFPVYIQSLKVALA